MKSPASINKVDDRSQVQDPGDRARREALAQMYEPAAAVPGGPGTDNPVLRGLPPEVRVLVMTPAARLVQSAKCMVDIRLGCDLPAITNEQRSLLNMPQAAQAPIVALQQARSLDGMPAEVAQGEPTAERMDGCCGQHEELRVTGTATVDYLDGVGVCLDVVRGVRVLLYGKAQAWLAAQRRATPADSPQQDRLAAMQRAIDSVQAKQKEAEAAARQQAAQQREAAQAQITDAEADYRLAEVMSQLRQGIMPDRAVLLEAAARYRQQQEAAAGAQPAVAAVAAGATKARKGGGTRAQAR